MKRWMILTLIVGLMVALPLGCNGKEEQPQDKAEPADTPPAENGDANAAPADTPDEPSDTPDEPADTPDEPADTPDEPADGGGDEATTGDKVPGPWANAKVGQSVTYETMGGMVTKYEVVDADENSVTIIETMMMSNGNEMSSSVKTHPRFVDVGSTSAEGQETQGKKLEDKTIKVGDTEYVCQVYESVTETPEGKEVTTRTYICAEVPTKMIMIESDTMGEMQTMQKLKEYKQD